VIFSVATTCTGYVCASVEHNRFASGLEEVDKTIVAMSQAGSCPAACMANGAIGNTLLVVLLVLTGTRRIPVTGTAIGEDVWVSNHMTIAALPCARIRRSPGCAVTLIAAVVKG